MLLTRGHLAPIDRWQQIGFCAKQAPGQRQQCPSVNPLLAQLRALAGALACAEGVAPEALEDVLRLLAACLVQQNPAAGAGAADPAFSQAVNEAAVAGAALAAEKTAAGISLRFVREPYLAASSDPGRPFRVAGPFVDEGAALLQFRFFESTPMRSVSLDIVLFLVEVHELLMRLPGDSVIDAALQAVSIPAGTVWLRAERLVPGTAGYAVLRVNGGTLQFGQPVTVVAATGGVQVPFGASWTLTLEPEVALPADASGPDANAMTLQLPREFELRSDGSSRVTGPIGITGFGSALSFDTPSGGAIAADQAIVYAYDVATAAWSIAGHRSLLLGLTGDCVVQAALWGLPLTLAVPDTAGEAAHGGLIGFRFQGTVQGRLSAGEGGLPWVDPSLIANAQGFEWRSRRASASAQLPHLSLGLWGAARSDLDAGGGLTDLRFASFRDGADILAWSGGRLRNQWDLPRDASGAPFACNAWVDAFSTVAEADGLRRVAVRVAQALPAPIRLHGLALENLYLSVSPVRRLGLAASGRSLDALASGWARLLFDVMLGEPMLPDPYAANWPPSDQFQLTEEALSVALRWQTDVAPALQVQLEKAVRFPEPLDIAAESDPRLGEQFRRHLQAQPEFMSLLDLSTRDHHFGVALEAISDTPPRIDRANRLSVELQHVRLLMQPQVHWEPVQVVPDPKTGQPLAEVLHSTSHGGQTLVGARTVKLVPVLPGPVSEEIAAVANGQRWAAALFSLPFGLRATVQMNMARKGRFPVPAITTDLHAPRFDAEFSAARQLRLRATGGRRAGEVLDPSRGMPGAMHQTAHVERSVNGLSSVLPPEITGMLNFDTFVPLHAADLSGYGLSSFSHWRREAVPPQVDAFGVTQVHLDVLVGRTVCELIEVRSVLACCQSRVVRTIVMERRNSGRVLRFDSGWQAIDDGLFQRYVKVETGVLRALRNIRRIRILAQPLLVLNDNTPDRSVWQPVHFDADAQVDDVVSGGKDGLVPALEHAGYIQLEPVWDPAKPVENTKEAPDAPRFAALFKAVGGSMGGAVDCRVRLGGSLEMHLSSLQAGVALDDDGLLGFAVAAYGSPTLPRAGQWSAVRIDGATSDVSPVDPRRGMPVIHRPGQPVTFRDPADAQLVRQRPTAEYGLLMSTPASRVLFPKPSVDPAQPGRLISAPPLMADPTCLLQGSGAFPRAALALQARELALFDISAANAWRLTQPDFTFAPPLPGVASGGGWGLARHFVADAITGQVPPFRLQIDSAVPALAWQVLQPPDEFKLDIAPFGTLLTIQSNFQALAGGASGLPSPTLLFGPALEAVQDIVNSLRAFIDLPFDVDVQVTAGQGASPSFAVQLTLKFRIGDGPDGRIDIGLGKFYGEFELDGRFEAALGGATHGRLTLVFQGDVQQGIIPPLLYAGGMFRFALEVQDGGKPVIELGLGTATSIGGDLIKGLLAVEATVKYGYMLIPESLKPGVMLGIDARAKLLAGLFALSFSADALARIERFNREDKTVTIFADLRVAGSVQVAVFFKERVDFRTQFEQRIPLAPLLIAAQVNPLLAVATTAVL